MTPRPLLIACIGFAAGCAPKAELKPVPLLQSAEWRNADSPGGPGSPGSATDLSFASADLRALTLRALAANADIAIARTRIDQARAELKVARAAMLPVVSASAGLNATRTDNQGGSAYDFSDAFAGLDVAFDTDLFGGRRAQRGAARERLVAAGFDRDSTALAVETEVARAFVQHAALADRLALLDRNLAAARELERIVKVRLREGVGTKVDTGLQAIEVRQLETERLRLVEAAARTQSALAVLVGEEAPRFLVPPARLATLSVPQIAPGQPAMLLVRRPDIKAAEARIRAASGDVASARAAFLPNLSLSASALGQAATLTGPFGATLSAGAGLLAPIFDGGRLKGELAGATAAQAQAVELYRRQLLVALGEAEDALAAVRHSETRQRLLGEAVGEARTTLRLRRLQYLEGEADLSDVVDAQRLVVEAEDAEAIALQERLNAAIDLYRAMGGSARS